MVRNIVKAAFVMSVFVVILAGVIFRAEAYGEKCSKEPGEICDPLNMKYYTCDDEKFCQNGMTIKPGSPLADLKKCDKGSLFLCEQGMNAVNGIWKPEYTETALDLLKYAHRERDGEWVWRIGSPEIAITLFGLLGDKANAKAGEDLINTNEKLDGFVKNLKPEIFDSLWWMGNKESASVMAKAIENKNYTGTHRAKGLRILREWSSKDAVPWCQTTLRDESDSDVVQACVEYLGWMKVAEALPMIQRLIDTYEGSAANAIGWLGDPKNKAILTARLEKYKPFQYTYRIPILGGLVNLGDAKAWQELLGFLNEKNYDAIGQAAVEMELITHPQYKTKVVAELTKAAKVHWAGKDNKLGGVYAAASLARLGSNAGGQVLKAALNDPKDEFRELAISLISTTYADYMGNPRRGLGSAKDPSLVPVLNEFIAMERKEEFRILAVKAIAEIKARGK